MRFPMASAGLALIALAACGQPELDQHRVLTWIDSKTAAPDLEVSGTWESLSSFMAGGWGSGTFLQTGARVSGTLGLYSLEGRVSGRQLYAMFLSRNRVYYTAVLELNAQGELVGVAYAGTLADEPDARLTERAPILLRRPAEK